MLIYSERIVRFIQEIQRIIKDVLSREMGLKVVGGRFHDRRGTASYPIKAVIYNHKSMLGYFDPNFYELGFHECLMHSSKELLRNVIRHELAHYMMFMQHGEGIQSHGVEFRKFCQQIGWGEEVYKATTCLETTEGPFDREESPVLRKVQKLMALASSSNQHESEQATIKSQQLLLKHNIDSTYLGSGEEEKVYLKRIMKQKRETAKMRAIAKILETFFVSIVYSRAGEHTYLEILGSAVNIEIAEHVAIVLDDQFDRLWKETRLKGSIAKNSFFLGLAKGYCNQLQALKKEYTDDIAHALLVMEKKLIDARALAYRRLSSKKSSAHHCPSSSALGERMGRQLQINPAIEKSSNTLIKFFP